MVPSTKGLTVIGGKNGQGKTSVLSAIAYALGGEKYRPGNLRREGALSDARIHIETDEGLVIERKGKNASLTVTDPSGRRGGQAILDEIVSKFAIDLPKFLHATDAERARILLGVLGIGDQIAALDREEKAAFDKRTVVGRQASQKQKAAEEMPYHEDAPEEPLSVSELIREQQDVLARNGANAQKRRHCAEIEAAYSRKLEEVSAMCKRLEEAERALSKMEEDVKTSQKSIAQLEDESTEEIEEKIRNFEEINKKVRDNMDRARVLGEAEDLKEQYDALSAEVEAVRKRRASLLEGADLPYPGLTVENGILLLNGKTWDCMSGSMQMVVASSIALRLNPKCRFVLADGMEALDEDTLARYDEWLREHDMQAICTRVSTGGECTLVIEDGEGYQEDAPETPEPPAEDDDEY
jgi:hypothetical protein